MSRPSPEAGRIRRRARVLAVDAAGFDVHWVDPRCRGCVGCGGRCGLFGEPAATTTRLDRPGAPCAPGMLVDVDIAAPALRRAAAAAYGLALLSLLAGVLLGHWLGARAGHPNAGALAGLVLGTFAAGRLTKRFDAAPPLGVHPIDEPDFSDPVSKEPPC